MIEEKSRSECNRVLSTSLFYLPLEPFRFHPSNKSLFEVIAILIDNKEVFTKERMESSFMGEIERVLYAPLFYSI